ncbi:MULTISPECIES: HNH endonuclease [Parafrankia]|uniref:HNH endonuclease n=1 Tax=Parafrankia TaxID=2994362 RepID=UPI000B87578C|nr:HNH endonuclease [Parafrankia sp. CH37]
MPTATLTRSEGREVSYSTAYYRSLPAETRREWNRAKARARRARLRAGGSSLSNEERRLIRLSSGCTYCGATLPNGGSEETDHLMPLSRSGADVHDNVVSSCGSCNKRKSRRTLLELADIEWAMVGRALLYSEKVQNEFARLLAAEPDPIPM